MAVLPRPETRDVRRPCIALKVEALALSLMLVGFTSGAQSVRIVNVTATDFAFRVPRELAPGPAAFHFVNNGKVPHEFSIVLLKRNVTIDQFIAAARAHQPLSPLYERPVGVLFAKPGTASVSELTTAMLPGRQYAALCTFHDKKDSPQHFEMGMYAALHVSGSSSHAPIASSVVQRPGYTVDTITATEYTFKFNSRVRPGHHTFVFRNAGKERHELNMALLNKGITLQKSFDVQKAGGDWQALQKDVGVLYAAAQTSPLGQIDLDLLPGRDYPIVCTFSKDDKSPPHFALGMLGTIHVLDR
jgi:hypothetical protein